MVLLPVPVSYEKSQAGFTLVELITVIIVVGVVAVTATSRFIGSDGIAEYTYQNRLVSTLRNMQQRAMNDTRQGICYRININSGSVAPAFGPPTDNFLQANSAVTCSSIIDPSIDLLSTSLTEIADNNIQLIALDGSLTTLQFIAFSSLGKPLTNESNCTNGCRITFQGSATTSVCVESEGYIHAC